MRDQITDLALRRNTLGKGGMAVATDVFLEPRDLETFEQDRQTYGRRLQELRQGGRISSQPLEDVVQDRVAHYLADRVHGFYCLGIEVYPGDGMSWSATSADSAIEETTPRVPRLHLKGQPGAGPYPALANLISMRRIAAQAQKRGIATSARLLGTRRYTVIILAAIAVGAAGTIASAAIKGGNFSSSPLTWPFAGLAVLSAGLAIISQLLNRVLNRDSPSSPLTKISEDIALQANAAEPSSAYWSFVDDLAVQFSKFPEFRCLIVDDFTNLDNVTRHVFESYLRNFASEKRDEFWILFYSTDDKRLEVLISRPERANRKPPGYRYTHLYLLEHLSADQRRQLAVAYGSPERAAFLTVRAIARDDSALVSLGALFRREYHKRDASSADPAEGDSLGWFYIFALNAIWAGNPQMDTYSIRQGFSQQRRFRSQLLELLMPRLALSPTAVTRCLDVMLASFFPLAGEVSGQGRRRTFKVAPEAGEYLEKSWRDFDLPNPGIVHLFWFLYWSDTELHESPSVALLRKISYHLLKSTPPAELGVQLQMHETEVAAFSDELFNTALEVLRACLKTCLLSDIADLLNHALRLTEDDREPVEQRRRARLRPLAWQAYGLLGDERLLGVILDLNPTAEPASGPIGPQSNLMNLFLGSMPRSDGDTSRLMRSELTRQGVAKHAGVYAVMRASWLAASLSPFMGPTSPDLTAAADDCRRQLPAVVSESVDNLEKVADREWQTTDILNVALGLWALALATDDSRAASALGWTHPSDANGTFIDDLVRTCVLAVELAEQRRSADPSPATLDLVLDCLAEEVLAVVLATAILILSRWPESAWTSERAWGDVLSVVSESATALGLSKQVLPRADGSLDRRLIQDAARRMTLLAFLWRRLGYAQLASFMTIRQAQFEALCNRADADLAQSTIALLSSDLGQADHIGLLAHLAAAEGSRFSAQLKATLLARGSQVSMTASFSEHISAELCMIAVEEGHSFPIDFSPCLDFLLARWVESGERRLVTLLADVSPQEAESLVLAFLNIVLADQSDRSDEVCAVLEERIAQISQVSEPEVRKKAEGSFRTFAVRRHIRSGQPVDVDVELDAWQNLRDLPSYANLINELLLVVSSGTRDRLIRESLDVLRSREPYIGFSSYVHLARDLFIQLMKSRTLAASEGAEVALSALRDGFEQWEPDLSADSNIEILMVLTQYDSDHADEYATKRLEWQRIVLELDETQRLPELIGQGRFFHLVWHYFEFFAYYGLQSEPPTDSFGLDKEEVAQALREWRASPRIAPAPIVCNGDERLSGEFLRIGYALFAAARSHQGGDIMSESELENGRQQFDEKARDVIETLYRLLGRLSRIPPSIEQILRRHEIFVLQRLNDFEANLTASSRHSV